MNIKVVNQQKDIVRVIINDPKTYNSLSTKNLNDLIRVFQKLDKDQKVKVIINLPVLGKLKFAILMLIHTNLHINLLNLLKIE